MVDRQNEIGLVRSNITAITDPRRPNPIMRFDEFC